MTRSLMLPIIGSTLLFLLLVSSVYAGPSTAPSTSSSDYSSSNDCSSSSSSSPPPTGGSFECPPFSTAPSGSVLISDCACNGGYYHPSNDSCSGSGTSVSSDTGSSSSDATAYCVACPEFSTSLPGATCVKQCVCMDGYHGDFGGPCVLNNNGGGNSNTPCQAGTSGPSGHLDNCTECPAGYYSLINDAGNYTDCYPCPAGYYAPRAGSIVGCLPCKGAPAGSIICNITSCPVNTYSADSSGSNSCTACPDHSTAPAGSNSIDDCVCDANYTRVGDACTAEQFVPCPADTYINGTGNNLQCVDCPEYSSSPANSNNVKACVCDKGYVGPAGGPCKKLVCRRCLHECDDGYYYRSSYPSGSSALVIGSDDDEDDDSHCVRCPAYSWSPAGSRDISDCVCWAGFIRVGDVCKLPCPIDTYDNGGATRLCVDCPEYATAPAGSLSFDACVCAQGYAMYNFTCVEAGQTLPCAEGTYSVTGTCITGNTTCTECPDDSSSPVGSKLITDCTCTTGYTGPAGGPCVEIVCANYTSSSQCLLYSRCSVLSGYDCNTGNYTSFMGCVDSTLVEASVNSSGECAFNMDYNDSHAWFPTGALPNGFVEVNESAITSCCPVCTLGETTCSSIGSGCPYLVNSTCAVFLFEGDCPTTPTAIAAWKANFSDQLGVALEGWLQLQNINVAEQDVVNLINQYLHFVDSPTRNAGTNTYIAHVQLEQSPLLASYTEDSIIGAIAAAIRDDTLVLVGSVLSQLRECLAIQEM